MLIVKFALLLAGMGTITGVTYSQTKTDVSKKTILVSNNQESNIRAKLEKQMNKELLEHKKQLLETSKLSSDIDLNKQKTEFEKSKTELTKSNDVLNDEKNKLNAISAELVQKYDDLKTKDSELAQALKTKMSFVVDSAADKLNKEFYESQQATYEKEKAAIKTKLESISGTTISEDICAESYSTPLDNKTSEEKTIKNDIQEEMATVCPGLQNNKVAHASNILNTQDDSDYDAKKTDRDNIVEEIRKKTSEYNLQTINIKYAESDVQMKLLEFRNTEQTYLVTKLNNEKIKNEIEILSEEIQNIN